MITIATRLRPFSHEPGSQCLIPGTTYLVEAFPALLIIKDFAGSVVKEFPLPALGPLKQFNVTHDLERGCVTVLSEQYRVHVLPNLEIVDSKHPHLPPLNNQERLSLGYHKKWDVDAIRRRRDFQALFPLWLCLGLSLKLPPRSGDNRGMFALLADCEQARDAHQPEKIIPAFEKLFLAGFSPFLVPRSVDEEKQGILPLGISPSDDSPLYLLSEGAALIRSLFILIAGNEISLLPNVPPELFAGRMTGLTCPSLGTLDLEWSKKTLTKLHFHALQEDEVIFHFPPTLVSCRVRMHPEDRGRVLICGDSLAIKSGSHYLLDRFQK